MLVQDILQEISRPLAKLGEDARLVDAAKRLHGPDASLVVVCLVTVEWWVLWARPMSSIAPATAPARAAGCP